VQKVPLDHNYQHCSFQMFYSSSPNSSWLVTSRHVQRVEPMHFGCVRLVEQHGSTRQACRIET